MAIRSPVFHWLSWLFPLILFTLISANFSEGTLLNLPVSAVDYDHSPLADAGAQSERCFTRQYHAAG